MCLRTGFLRFHFLFQFIKRDGFLPFLEVEGQNHLSKPCSFIPDVFNVFHASTAQIISCPEFSLLHQTQESVHYVRRQLGACFAPICGFLRRPGSANDNQRYPSSGNNVRRVFSNRKSPPCCAFSHIRVPSHHIHWP